MWLTLVLTNGCSITARMERNHQNTGWAIGEEGCIYDSQVEGVYLPTDRNLQRVTL